MKLTRIQTANFLGATAVDVRLTKPVALFAGKNGAGKSSLRDAIAFALTGESPRGVSLKKDYGTLLTEGAESGFCTVTAGTIEASVVLPSGKRTLQGSEPLHGALPYVLDAPKFAALDANGRRSFLFALMGLRTDGPAVQHRLIAKGADEKLVDQIGPILRAGFDAAAKEAATKAREAKAGWKAVTGGETYGSQKAKDWRAPCPTIDADAEAAAAREISALSEQIDEASRAHGALIQRQTAARAAAARAEKLRETAGTKARAAKKLAFDESERDAMRAKVAEARQHKTSGGNLKPVPCPECAALLLIEGGKLTAYHREPGDDTAAEGAAAELPRWEAALQLLERAVENSRRDLAAAEAAAAQLADMADAEAEPSEDDITDAAAKVTSLRAQQAGVAQRLERLRAEMRAAAEADSKTRTAAGYHATVVAWELIADALSPDGIPGEIIAEALDPINRRLFVQATDAQWALPNIGADMQILVGGRPYALLSESEQWRADALLAEAISHISGLRLLVLDRFDVLDNIGREDALYWLDGLAEDGEIDAALVFGTLKALPGALPAQIEAHWIENGRIGQIKEAA